MKLTAKEANRLLHYDARTGIVTWKVSISNRAPVGTVVNTVHSTGSIFIGIYRKRYKLHRVIWFMKTGRWPKEEIDHKNTNAADNRWKNLREATSSQNKINKDTKNSTGFRGVTPSRKGDKWTARIKRNYKQKYLGTFNTPLAAHVAYCKEARILFGEFAYVRR